MDLLFHTCALNDLEGVRWLISQCVDINARHRPCSYGLGMSPLHCAVQCEYFDIVHELVNSNADINRTDDMGATALHYAVDKNNLELVQYLLSKGANINARTIDGITPLHNVSKPFIAQELINHKADVNSKDEQGNTPLHTVSQSGIIDMVTFLLPYYDPTIKNNRGETPCDLAITLEIKNLIQTYIAMLVDIKEPVSVDIQ